MKQLTPREHTPPDRTLTLNPPRARRSSRARSASPPSYLIGLGLVVGLAVAGLWPAQVQARGAPESFADLAEKLLPAVVNISTLQVIRGQRGPEVPQFPPGSPFEEFFKDFFERRLPESPMRRATSLGSGFIIDSTGYVVTNNHVIEGADEITVILHDETTLEATVVGRDPKTDIALLKVEVDRSLPAVTWGDSNKTRVGDWVVAIGNPFGFGGTVTAGIISASGRELRAGPYDDFIQTDAAINRGNSGGPMFNLDGEVIGINTAIISPTGGSIGLGFAVPSSQAKVVVNQLRDFGRTRRGWLGVRIQTVTDEIAEGLGLDSGRGALVASVAEDGPAAAAGIEQGDVILEFDGKDVARMRDLPRIVAETPIGKAVEVTVWRKGRQVGARVEIGELEETEQVAAVVEPEETEEKAIVELGVTLSSISPELMEKFELREDASGVVVTGVAANSAAAEKGINPGDVILEVSQEKVINPAQVAAKVLEAQEAGRKSILLLVDQGGRQGQPAFMALRIDQG